MTDRHLHCVYFKYDDRDNPKGFCLLKQKPIEYGFKACCEDIVLRPVEVLGYYIHNKHGKIYSDALLEATDFIADADFNYYPQNEVHIFDLIRDELSEIYEHYTTLYRHRAMTFSEYSIIQALFALINQGLERYEK